MTEEKFREKIEELMEILKPFKEQLSIAIVVCDPNNETEGYSFVGNMSLEDNARLIRDVAIDMATKDWANRLDQAIAMEESRGKTIQ